MVAPYHATQLRDAANKRKSQNLDSSGKMSSSIPVIDIGPLLSNEEDQAGVTRVASEIRRACTEIGFFYVRNFEAVAPKEDIDRLEKLAREFFCRPVEEKKRIAMTNSGKWRTFVPTEPDSVFSVVFSAFSSLYQKQKGAIFEAEYSTCVLKANTILLFGVETVGRPTLEGLLCFG